ncbi:MAG: GHMP kinase [Halobacteriovoraceae bacterium]|nr:GHMP kinase [Halobacteriovoraceae bacterium]|tara:strand:- start:49 stop:1041 length:993 start_codon:yes stop_codon:yes gene_type:complete
MREQTYYGHGKLLLSGEYFVLDGAKSLALPCKLGQVMNVKHSRSNNPTLHWKSYDHEGKLWFEAKYELWRFRILTEENQASIDLQKILQQARHQNIHFLRDEVDTLVETRVEFPLNWGLGSSSTLIYNIAQWAYISPFELLAKTFGGSGYDIACAQSMGPIIYSNLGGTPSWQSVNFSPLFKDKLYFVHLNQKQNSRREVERYQSLELEDKRSLIKQINSLTLGMSEALDLQEFEAYIFEHENLLSHSLDMPRVKDLHFQDYWGAIKSLGAWGGDFALATSDKGIDKTREYFASKGFETVLGYDEIICSNPLSGTETLSQLNERLNEAEV